MYTVIVILLILVCVQCRFLYCISEYTSTCYLNDTILNPLVYAYLSVFFLSFISFVVVLPL